MSLTKKDRPVYTHHEDQPERGENWIEGRQAVQEALRSGRPIDKLYLLREGDATLRRIAAMAREKGVVVVQCERRSLDHLSQTGAHQGVGAYVAAHAYSTLEDILARSEQSGRAPLVVVCDGITDPQNLGAVIRSAEASGVHGIILPKRRSVGLTAAVHKASAGALEHMPVARVPNIPAVLDELKKAGLWIYGTAAGEGGSLYKTDLTGPAAIVLGSEGDGMGQLVTRRCDMLIGIPMLGKVGSLSVSAAAAVVLFEVLRQRETQP